LDLYLTCPPELNQNQARVRTPLSLYLAVEVPAQTIQIVRTDDIAPLIDHFGEGHSVYARGFGHLSNGDPAVFLEFLLAGYQKCYSGCVRAMCRISHVMMVRLLNVYWQVDWNWEAEYE